MIPVGSGAVAGAAVAMQTITLNLSVEPAKFDGDEIARIVAEAVNSRDVLIIRPGR